MNLARSRVKRSRSSSKFTDLQSFYLFDESTAEIAGLALLELDFLQSTDNLIEEKNSLPNFVTALSPLVENTNCARKQFGFFIKLMTCIWKQLLQFCCGKSTNGDVCATPIPFIFLFHRDVRVISLRIEDNNGSSGQEHKAICPLLLPNSIFECCQTEPDIVPTVIPNPGTVDVTSAGGPGKDTSIMHAGKLIRLGCETAQDANKVAHKNK